MKKLLVFIVLVAAVSSQTITFEQYKTKFKKSYKTVDSGNKAKLKFEAKQSEITAFNADKTKTFKQGVNHFTDLLGSTMLTAVNKGFKKPPFSNIVAPVAPVAPGTGKNKLPAFVPPNSIDWRTKGVVTPVQFQGYTCASCWAFATAGAIESGIAILTSKPPVKLSEQQLVDCNYNINAGNYGCEGGIMPVAFQYAQTTLIATAAAYPYVEAKSLCNSFIPQTNFSLTQPVILPTGDEFALMQAVAQYGPITAAVDASLDSFISYSSGVYYDINCSQWITHAILVVGYGTDPVGGDYWLIKNSWGTSWGEAGYIRLARNRDNHCGIASYAVYANLSPTI